MSLLTSFDIPPSYYHIILNITHSQRSTGPWVLHNHNQNECQAERSRSASPRPSHESALVLYRPRTPPIPRGMTPPTPLRSPISLSTPGSSPPPPPPYIEAQLVIRPECAMINPFCRPFNKNNKSDPAWETTAKWVEALRKAVDYDAAMVDQYVHESPVIWVGDVHKNYDIPTGHNPRLEKNHLVALDTYVSALVDERDIAAHRAIWAEMAPQNGRPDNNQSASTASFTQHATLQYFLQVIGKFIEVT